MDATDFTSVSRAVRTLALSFALAAVSLSGTVAAASAETEFYVSPTGSDRGSGTLASPFATLKRAQSAVRAVTAEMSTDVVVNLRGGTYHLDSPLALNSAKGDSGRNGHRVVYRAYGYGTAAQEHPVLSGGRAVRHWKLVDPARHIWRADVGGLASRQLYRDGRRLEQGSIKVIPGRVTRTAKGYETTSKAPRSWTDPSSIEFVYTPTGYAQAICGVARIAATATGTAITMDQPCFRWVSANYTYNEADPSKPLKLQAPSPLKNSRGFLRRAGQWAIDRGKQGHHQIYFRSARGEDPNRHRFVAPVLQTLLSGVGNKVAPLHDVSFQGLTFADATWTAPNSGKGLVQVFGDYYFNGGSPSGSLTEPTTRVLFVPGNLRFEFTRGLLFEGNRFIHLGADGVTITGSIENVFRGNVFAEGAGGALKLNGLDDGSDAGNLFEDNWVHDVGADYQGSIGVYLEDIVDSTLRHNQIDDLPFSGISQTISEAKGRGVHILDNRIYDVVQVLMDGGAIYTSGSQGPSWSAGGLIEGNDVHGALNPRMEKTDPDRRVGAPNGIYTDVGADFITLRDNVLYDNHQSWGGVAPKRMRFNHNFWDDDKLIFYGSRKGLRIEANRLLPRTHARVACRRIAACREILGAAGLEPAWHYLLGS
jgi:hypothetical protein